MTDVQWSWARIQWTGPAPPVDRRRRGLVRVGNRAGDDNSSQGDRGSQGDAWAP